MLRVVLFTVGVCVASDPCKRLCKLDGPKVCTGGSYDKKGRCHAYLFLGDPENNQYCYHTKQTADSCPSKGKAVKVEDAARLIAIHYGPQFLIETAGNQQIDANEQILNESTESPFTPATDVATSSSETPTTSTTTDDVTSWTTTTTTTTSVTPGTSTITTKRPKKVKPEKGTREVIQSPGGDVYHLISSLGEGSQSEVFLSHRESDDKMYALKQIKKQPAAAREVEAMTAVRGIQGFSQIVDSFPCESSTCIVMGLLGKSISELRIDEHGRTMTLGPNVVGAVGLQMIDRMQTLHSMGVVHLDLYHYNCALDNGQLVLFDFGKARKIEKDSTPRVDVRSVAHSMLRLLDPRTPYKTSIDGAASLADVCVNAHPSVLKLFQYAYEELGKRDAVNYDRIRDVMRELAPDYAGRIDLV
jgi:tRNA A-37 threonylcarbamoyl transferase component Bud32